MHRWETQWWKTSNKPLSCGWVVQPWPFSQMSNTWQNAKRRRKNLQANNSLRQEAHVLSAFCQHHQAPKCATPGFHNTSPGSHNPKTAEILKYHDASKSNEHHLNLSPSKPKKLWIALLSFQGSFWVILYHNPRSRTTKLKQPIACK